MVMDAYIIQYAVRIYHPPAPCGMLEYITLLTHVEYTIPPYATCNIPLNISYFGIWFPACYS